MNLVWLYKFVLLVDLRCFTSNNRYIGLRARRGSAETIKSINRLVYRPNITETVTIYNIAILTFASLHYLQLFHRKLTVAYILIS